METYRKRQADLWRIVLLPLAALLLSSAEHFGLLDRALGFDEVERIAERFETSYDSNVDRQVGPDEPGFRSLLRLIGWYGRRPLPPGREPKMVVRLVSVTSARVPSGPGEFAEWTAPTTPIYVLFVDLEEGARLGDGAVEVGTIGDLRSWVQRGRERVRFGVGSLITVLLVVLGVMVWRWSRLTPNEAACWGRPPGPWPD